MYKESESKKGGRDEVTADRGLPRIWASSWCTVLSVSPFAIRPLVYKFAEWRAIRADCALFGFPLSLLFLPSPHQDTMSRVLSRAIPKSLCIGSPRE